MSSAPARDTELPAKFARLFAEAAPLVLAGRHQRDSPPREGGRWPLTVVLPPDAGLAGHLDHLAAEGRALAGAGHWSTGARGSAHVTVTALEDYRAQVPDGDPRVASYARALARAADRCGPVTLWFGGLTLTAGTVMACAKPVDDGAERFRAALAEELVRELGPTGWVEWDIARDIWYANVIHFAGDVADAPGLVEWVAQRRHLDLGTFVFTRAQLWRYRFGDSAPRPPIALASETLRG